jgi:triacylglycerol lipase
MVLGVMDPATALEWGKFSRAAGSQYSAAPQELSPGSINDMPPGYELRRTIQITDSVIPPFTERKFYGFLAVGGVPQSQIIALRGTRTPIEWLDNLHFWPVRFDLLPATKVAEGFKMLYESFTSMIPGGGVEDPPGGLAGELDPNLPVILTGHSLGGALATLLAADLAINHGLKPEVWTFGSPMVGDSAFAAAYNAVTTTSWRIYNMVDIVPRLPPDLLGAFQHVNTGYPLNSEGQVRKTIPCAHAMSTYLHLLPQSNVALDPDCQLNAGLLV